MKLYPSTHDSLQIALNNRMNECKNSLIDIVLAKDFITLDGIDGINALASKKLQKHFSISAYKAMLSAKEKLSLIKLGSELEFQTFTSQELVQMTKAIGALSSEHAELSSWLVDALVWNLFNERGI